MTPKELKHLGTQVSEIMRAHVDTAQTKSGDVTIIAKTYGDGITYQQIMQLRELFGCEFNIGTDYIEGITTDAGTWFPGESFFVFTYQGDPK